jgi:hypothetical protein
VSGDLFQGIACMIAVLVPGDGCRLIDEGSPGLEEPPHQVVISTSGNVLAVVESFIEAADGEGRVSAHRERAPAPDTYSPGDARSRQSVQRSGRVARQLDATPAARKATIRFNKLCPIGFDAERIDATRAHIDERIREGCKQALAPARFGHRIIIEEGDKRCSRAA